MTLNQERKRAESDEETIHANEQSFQSATYAIKKSARLFKYSSIKTEK